MNQSANTSLGVMCSVFTSENVEWNIDPAEYEKIDAAWSRYIDSGRRLDTILDIRQEFGADLRICASDVRALVRTTREQRAELRRRQLAWKAEKREDGIIDED